VNETVGREQFRSSRLNQQLRILFSCFGQPLRTARVYLALHDCYSQFRDSPASVYLSLVFSPPALVNPFHLLSPTWIHSIAPSTIDQLKQIVFRTPRMRRSPRFLSKLFAALYPSLNALNILLRRPSKSTATRSQRTKEDSSLAAGGGGFDAILEGEKELGIKEGLQGRYRTRVAAFDIV